MSKVSSSPIQNQIESPWQRTLLCVFQPNDKRTEMKRICVSNSTQPNKVFGALLVSFYCVRYHKRSGDKSSTKTKVKQISRSENMEFNHNTEIDSDYAAVVAALLGSVRGSRHNRWWIVVIRFVGRVSTLIWCSEVGDLKIEIESGFKKRPENGGRRSVCLRLFSVIGI